MSVEENKAICHRFFEEVFDERNLDLMEELSAATYVYHGPGGREVNLQGLKQLLTMYFNALPDLQATVEDLVAEGDTVATRYTLRGTHKGDLIGIPPTNKQVIAMGIVIDRIVGGKFVESWGLLDQLSILQQVGAIPPIGGSGG